MYISPVDILGISIDEVMDLDARGLVRLEKRLKLRKLQNKSDGYNPQQFDDLLEQLADPEKKKSIVLVERHPLLKDFITTGKDVGPRTFGIDDEILAATPHIDEFLAPYFDAYFMRMVKRDFASRKYDTVIRAMEHKALFSTALLTKYYEYVNGQLEILVEKISVARNGKLLKKCPQVVYTTLVDMMNTVPLGFIKETKLLYVNTLVDYYNSTKNRYAEFATLRTAFRNFTRIDMGNQDIHSHLRKLSIQIGGMEAPEYVASSGSSSSSSSTSWSGMRVLGIIFGIMVFVGKVARVFKSDADSSPDYSNTLNVPILKTSYEDDKTGFYSDLIHRSSGDSIGSGTQMELETGMNPYPLQFKLPVFSKSRTKWSLPIYNHRSEPLVLFIKKNEKRPESKAVYIGAGDSLFLSGIRKWDRMVFYTGSELVRLGNSSRLVTNNGRREIRPSRRYFRSVGEKGQEWLKKAYMFHSFGNRPKVELTEDYLVFQDVNELFEFNELLDPEPLEITEENFAETSSVAIEPEDIAYLTERNDIGLRSAPKADFFSGLKQGAQRVGKGQHKLDIRTGENPYPQYFKGQGDVGISGYHVPIFNLSNEDLIVFSRNLNLARDQAIFIKRNTNSHIFLHNANDTLIFYKGRDFYRTSPISGTESVSALPDGFFGKVSNSGKNLLDTHYIVKGLGGDPKIQVNNAGVYFEKIDRQVLSNKYGI